MIKYFFCLFIFLSINSCNSYSQTDSDSVGKFGLVIIDKSIEKKFFKKPPKRFELGVGEVKINSYISDTANSLPLFDTCRCILKANDSLVFEFNPIMVVKYDTIKIIMLDEKYNTYYSKNGVHYSAVSGFMKLRKKPHKKGQEIFGELGLEFIQDSQNTTRFFRGPFRCIVQ